MLQCLRTHPEEARMSTGTVVADSPNSSWCTCGTPGTTSRQGRLAAFDDVERLFNEYTALRIRTSGFLRQVEKLAEEWETEDLRARSTNCASGIASTFSELETITGAINMLGHQRQRRGRPRRGGGGRVQA